VHLTVHSYVLILPVLVCWFSAILYLKGARKISTSPERLVLLTAFILYLLAVVHFTVFPIRILTGQWRREAEFHETVNLIPLHNVDRGDFILNVIMTVPLGVMLPIVWRRARTPLVMAAVALSVGSALETNQYIMRLAFANDRNVNMNDVISNGTGVVIGYALFRYAMEDPVLQTLIDRLSVQPGLAIRSKHRFQDRREPVSRSHEDRT
jgi:glycopeptide antibiotics resistance protein